MLLLTAALAGYSTYAATPTLTGVDVGTPSMPGSTTTAADGKITVVGGGSDIWNNSDNFHYAYFKVTGDFDYVVKVESLTGNTGDGGWSKAELMARQEDPASAGAGPQGGDPHISNMTTRPAADTADGVPAGVNYRGPQWRANRDGLSSWTTPSPVITPNLPNNWMRLERVGNVFYMYWSNDGKTWSMYSPYDPQGWDTSGSWPPGTDNPTEAFFSAAWPQSIFLGIAVTAHSDPDTTTAVFSNFGSYTPVPIAITTQPAAAASIASNAKLTLSVAATGDPVHYQWRKDGKDIARAVGATYTVDLAKTSDSGSYTVRVFGAGKEVISSSSVVTVTQDTAPPTIAKMSVDSSFTAVKVQYSEPVTDSALAKANYALDKSLTISSIARLAADSVVLTTSKMAEGTDYTLTVNGVQDTASPANTIAASTKAAFKSAVFQTGWASYERWSFTADPGGIDILDAALKDGSMRAPDITSAVSEFGSAWGVADYYFARVSGYFVPPSNGNYVFFVDSDDQSNLYLSTDETPANKKLIAQGTGLEQPVPVHQPRWQQ